jgi:hypothetical protein
VGWICFDLEGWGCFALRNRGDFSYFFLVKKVSKKTFVAEKASAFIAKRSLQKQNSSFLLKQLFLLRYLIR